MRWSNVLLKQVAHGVEEDQSLELAPNGKTKTRRPALPLLLLPFIVLFLGIILGESLSREMSDLKGEESFWLISLLAAALKARALPAEAPIVAVVTLLLMAASACAILRFMHNRRLVVFGLASCALILGCSTGLHHWSSVQENARSLAKAEKSNALITVTSDAQSGLYATTSLAEIRTQDGFRGIVRIQWQRGQEVRAQGVQFQAAYSFTVLKSKDTYLFEQGICGTITISDASEGGFRPDALGLINSFRIQNLEQLEAIEGEGSALLSGVLLGNTERLKDSDTEQSFQITGLSHLIAVSGSHLVVIASLLGWLLSKLPGCRGFEIFVVILVLGVYVIFTGLQASAIRAAVMSGVSSCAFFAHRRTHTPSALSVAASAMLLLHPPNAFSLGFWLSVVAVFGITLFNPLLTSWFSAPLNALTRVAAAAFPRYRTAIQARSHAFATALSMTCTAQAATFPLTIPSFSMLPLISPVANLIVTPLVTIMVSGGMLALCIGVVLPLPAHYLLQALCGVGAVASCLADWLSSIPFAAIPFTLEALPVAVGALLIAGILYFVWPQPSKSLGVTLLCALVLVPSVCLAVLPQLTPPQLVMLDVGQGDALLVREGKRAILIDTGPNETALVKALARQQVTHLDAVIITHLDADHCGALGALRGLVQVDQCYFAAGILENEKEDATLAAAQKLVGKNGVLEVQIHDLWQISQHLSLEVVWPDAPVHESENENSLCLMLSYDAEGDGTPEQQALLAGDAESPQVSQMLDAGFITSCDILKLGHHGSKNSITAEQLECLQVQRVLISVGAQNRFGHPTQAALDALSSRNIPLMRTDLDGDVILPFAP